MIACNILVDFLRHSLCLKKFDFFERIASKWNCARSLLWMMMSLSLLIGHKGLAEESQKGVCQPILHQQNQRLCARILQRIFQTLPSFYTPQQRAHGLSLQLDGLARELLSQGLDLNAYCYEHCHGSPYLQFAMIPLWEGANDQPEIPLTLFIYVWPPENLAKQAAIFHNALDSDPRKGYYATHIHGHPLSCAVTVLKGTICQENYHAVGGWPFKVAQKKDEEILRPGTTTFDDNADPFIHRLICRDENQGPAFTLHGYGASSSQTVLNIFQTTFEQYSYHYILKENGKLIYQAW